MPRLYKLTWQQGTQRRRGRWRKKYRGETYYFDGGRGKTDREAYEAALLAFERRKLEVDATAPKPHQAAYESAMRRWELVATWCRQHNDDEMAGLAVSKLKILQSELQRSKPRPLAPEHTFESHFELSTRYPKLAEMMFPPAILGESNTTISLPVFFENAGVLWEPRSLTADRAVWNDRLDSMQRESPPPSRHVGENVERFLNEKHAAAKAKTMSLGRVANLVQHLGEFVSWLGKETDVEKISGQTLTDYRLVLLAFVETGEISRRTASDKLSNVKSFIRWLWWREVIPSLPRNLDGRSGDLKISHPPTKIIVFETGEITTLLQEASDRTRLYLLLMLNCGMTQKDIADLEHPEVDWDIGRITRKRSKTKEYDSVPEVSYVLWDETFRLLRQEQTPTSKKLVLLNRNDEPLWTQTLTAKREYTKNDNIRSAYERLKTKTNVTKSLKSLKKTSATLLRNEAKFATLFWLFLGHSERSMSGKHYTLPPQDLLDEAIRWLGKQFKV